MNNKQIEQVLIAMMYASGMSPQIEDDYYENFNGTSLGMFLEAICNYFEVARDSYIVHFNSLDYLDTPSATIKFFTINKDALVFKG